MWKIAGLKAKGGSFSQAINMNFREQFMQKHLPSRIPRGIAPTIFYNWSPADHSMVACKRQIKKKAGQET